MNWFIIIVAILVMFVLFKVSHLKHTKHKFVLIAMILILVFFVSSLYFVSQANNVDITTLNGLSKGMQIYSGWLLNSFNNIGSITGYAVGLDWNSKNKTATQNVVNETKEIGGNIVQAGSEVVTKVKPNTPKPITNYK